MPLKEITRQKVTCERDIDGREELIYAYIRNQKLSTPFMQVGVSKEPFDQAIPGKEVLPLLQRPMEARDKGADSAYLMIQ